MENRVKYLFISKKVKAGVADIFGFAEALIMQNHTQLRIYQHSRLFSKSPKIPTTADVYFYIRETITELTTTSKNAISSNFVILSSFSKTCDSIVFIFHFFLFSTVCLKGELSIVKEGESCFFNLKCRSPNNALKRKPNYDSKEQLLPYHDYNRTKPNLKP